MFADLFYSRLNLRVIIAPLQNQHQTKDSPAAASMSFQTFRGYQRPNGSARELDMIDELDETNPLGVALHHGGPYEAIQKMTIPRMQAQQTAYTVSVIDLLPSAF